jgi:hypothetical protein
MEIRLRLSALSYLEQDALFADPIVHAVQ